MYWQVAEAKNKLSKLLDLAEDKKPQSIRRRDEEFILLTKKQYDRETGRKKTFVEHLMSGPGLHDLDLTRDKSPMRDIEF